MNTRDYMNKNEHERTRVNESASTKEYMNKSERERK